MAPEELCFIVVKGKLSVELLCDYSLLLLTHQKSPTIAVSPENNVIGLNLGFCHHVPVPVYNDF